MQRFIIAGSILNILYSSAGLLSHDANSDDKPKKAYNPPTNWFGVEESEG